MLGLLPVAVSAGLLAFIWNEFGELSILRDANWGLVAVAAALSITINVYVGAFKWRQTIALCGIEVSARDVRRLWTGLLPATFFTPFQSGHLLYAVALWRGSRATIVEATECVAYDKYLSLIGTFGLVAVGQAFLPEGHVAGRWWILAGSIAAVVAYFLDGLVLKLLGRIAWFRERSRLLRRPVSAATKLRLLLLAMFYQSSDTFSALLVVVALGGGDLWTVAGAVPIGMLLSYVPITVSGFGAREALFVWLLTGAVSAEHAVGVGLGVDVLEYVGPALFGLVSLRFLLTTLAGGRGPRASQNE